MKNPLRQQRADIEGKIMKDVIIIGTGGHAKVVADIVMRCGDSIRGFLTSDKGMDSFLGLPVLGAEEDFINYPDCAFVIAIGDGEARARISAMMDGVDWYTAVHPAAVVSPLETSIAEGSVVMARAVINPFASVGRHCIINTAAVVEHDNTVGDFSHISVGTVLAGRVKVGKNCFVGVGAAVSSGVSVCDGCTVGAGAAVVKDITEPGIYAGVPARKIK